MSGDEKFMLRALELARRGCGHTRPNPPVGAVVVKGGKIVGEGWHRRAGGDHAEVAAIKDAHKRLRSHTPTLPRSSTLYVTLEPCSKPGRVGACTDAIIAAGISRVVYAIPDPNPKNRGKAKRVLSKAGIACKCLALDRRIMSKRASGDAYWLQICVKCAMRVIAPFAKHVATGLPYVTVKLAMSLDGKICDDRGDAKWISSAASRRATGRYRSEVDAIMVGAETVRKDDPSLLSHCKPNKDLVRVVISRSGKLPKNAQVFTDGKNETLVFGDARKALEELGRRGFLHVLCEGGLRLATSLAEAGLVDEWIAVTAPIVIGTRPISKAVRMKLDTCGFSDPRADDRIGYYGLNAPTALA